MLSPKLVADIERLLAEGHLSQRKIAEAKGVSRSTVALIAAGKRPKRLRALDDELPQPLHPPVRCPGCGGRIEYLPCGLCLARAEAERRHGAAVRDPLRQCA